MIRALLEHSGYALNFPGSAPSKWEDFKKRYKNELKNNSEAVAKLLEHMAQGKVTFVYSAKDKEHNDAVVLAEYLERVA